MALLSLSFASPLFASVAQKTGCTYYVDGAAGDNGNTGGFNDPFSSPQGAENWLENDVAHHGTPYTVLAGDKQNHTYTQYVITSNPTICVTNSTTYQTQALPGDFGSNANTGYPVGSLQNYTLEIKATGTPTSTITFTAYDPANPPIIQQSGFAGIRIDPTANYITLSNLIVMGHAYEAVQNVDSNGQLYALGRYKNTTSPNSWTFYDGDCIDVHGNAVDWTSGEPLGVPVHIKILHNQFHACGGAGIGAGSTDYLTISDNAVYDNAWWSIFGESAISNRGVDSETYPTKTGTPVTNAVKTAITGNYIFNNREYLPWDVQGKISDGEGIVIDTNSNVNYKLSTGVSYYVSPYSGQVQITDNAIWMKGSSGGESFLSSGVTISNNTLYHNIYYPPILKGLDDTYAPLDPGDGYPTAN